jgi:superfamily II DNA or RNA helicase
MKILNAFSALVEKTIKEINAIGKAIDINFNFKNNIIVNTMRENQKKVYDNYRYTQYLIIKEPPGAGKSTTVKFVFANRLKLNPNHKVLIAVPQTMIAKSFGKTILQYEDGTEIEWDMGKNLCGNFSIGKKGDQLLKFLKKKNFTKGIHSRIGITTHMALARAPKEIWKHFEDTTLVIDEAHHVLCPDNGDTATSNKIGNLIYSLLNKNYPTTSIWLITATYFRGDKGVIINDEHLSRFKEHYLPMDEHWAKNIKYIKGFDFNFVMFGNDVIGDAIKLLKQKKRKTIIFCPYNGHLLNDMEKLEFSSSLINRIKEFWTDCNIVDLVDPWDRDSRKKRLLYDDDFAKSVDIVLSAKLFDEGSDWIYADQIIDLYPSSSLRILVQRIGRLWRDLLGKSHLTIHLFLPFKSKFENDEQRRDYCTKNYSCLVASMILHEAFEPIKYPYDEKTKGLNPFEFAVPNETTRQTILEEVIRQITIFRHVRNPTPRENQNKVQEVLSSFGISDPTGSISLHIGRLLIRSTANITRRTPNYEKGTDISWVTNAGYDEIFKKDLTEGLLAFGTETSGIETFAEFRRIYGGVKITVDEWVVVAEGLADDNGGILYRQCDLIKMGYRGLVSCMYAYPKKFEHIKQEVRPVKVIFMELEDHEIAPEFDLDVELETARRLAEINNGAIPPNIWLIKNKHMLLVKAIREYPNEFNGMFQYNSDFSIIDLGIDHDIKNAKEYISLAESLTGIDLKKLKEEHATLLKYMHKYPALFENTELFRRKDIEEKYPEIRNGL